MIDAPKLNIGGTMRKKMMIIISIGLFFLSQSIGAQTWDPSKRLTWNSAPSSRPDATVDANNNIHVIWDDSSPGNTEIYYKKSTNGGISWTTKRLSWNSGTSKSSSIDKGPGNQLYVVWGDDTPGQQEIYFKKSDNGGNAWSASKRLTWHMEGSLSPDIAADSNGTIHVVWRKGYGDSDIYYKRSTDGGTTWTGATRLTWTDNSINPVIAVDTNDNVHIAWEVDPTGQHGEIYYKRSTDGGVNWTGSQRLTWTLKDSQTPAITIDNQNGVQLVWDEYNWSAWPYDVLPSEIFHKRSTDSGITWKKTKQITSLSHESIRPVIAADSNNSVYLVWVLYNLGASYDNELYFKKSTNNGLYWSPATKLTWTYDNNLPSIIIDSLDNIYIVFENGWGVDQEIYYKKGK